MRLISWTLEVRDHRMRQICLHTALSLQKSWIEWSAARPTRPTAARDPSIICPSCDCTSHPTRIRHLCS